MSDDQERLARADGHRYDAPETAEERTSKGWAYGVLALLVVVLMALLVTGRVPGLQG